MNASEYFDRLRARLVTIVVDDPACAPLVSELGPVAALADHDLLAAHEHPALLVTSRLETVAWLYDHFEELPTPLTHLSLARYDAGPAATRHAVAQLSALDAAAALALRAARYEALLSCERLELVAASSRVHVRCAGELEIPNTSSDVRPFWLQSVTELLEASMVNLESEQSSFAVEGELVFDGLAYLCNDADVAEQHGSRLRELVRAAAAGGGNHLVLADNRVTRLVLDGHDATDALAELLRDDARGTSVLELGLGCAELRPDFAIDSPLHKCCRGAFLGVGTGHRGPHIDFIACGADVRAIAPTSS